MTPDDARSMPWLDVLADVPDWGVWPRLMSGSHPRAVGSYGPRFVAWVADRGRWPLWWWQQLAATRMLEHDHAGRLVWRVVGLSTSRQVGKSYLLGMLFLWRLTEGPEIFGEPSPIMHISKDLAVSREVQKPMRVYGREHPETYKVREGAGNVEIEHIASGAAWVLRSVDGPYGHTSSVAAVDEAWAVEAEVVDDGLAPTQAQRRSPQLLLVSTAHKKATPLMIGRRASALHVLDEPDGTLWIEWSAAPEADLTDRAAWRQASPQWDDDREAEVRRALTTAIASRTNDPTAPDPLESFATQWLNRWPDSVEPKTTSKGELLIDVDAWEALHEELTPTGVIVVGIEDHFGSGCAVAAVADVDGTYYIESELHPNRDRAFERAGALLHAFPYSRLVVGASIVADPKAVELSAEARGQSEVTTALSLLRELVATGRLRHWEGPDGSCPLSEQLHSARVTQTPTGRLALMPGARLDALRAALMALDALVHDPPLVPAVY